MKCEPLDQISNDLIGIVGLQAGEDVKSLRRLPRSSSTRLVLNRKLTVVVPKTVSHYFMGLRFMVRGVWKQGARHRYVLASAVEPMETSADWSLERLGRALLGCTAPTGEQTAVLTVLAPALSWLLTAGLRRLAMTVRGAQGSRYDTVVFLVPPVAKGLAEEVHMQYVGLTRGCRATLCYAS